MVAENGVAPVLAYLLSNYENVNAQVLLSSAYVGSQACADLFSELCSTDIHESPAIVKREVAASWPPVLCAV